jgi:hypothetical protein
MPEMKKPAQDIITELLILSIPVSQQTSRSEPPCSQNVTDTIILFFIFYTSPVTRCGVILGHSLRLLFSERPKSYKVKSGVWILK